MKKNPSLLLPYFLISQHPWWQQVDGGWLLDGQKRWIGNSTFADVLVVFARSSTTNQINGLVEFFYNLTVLFAYVTFHHQHEALFYQLVDLLHPWDFKSSYVACSTPLEQNSLDLEFFKFQDSGILELSTISWSPVCCFPVGSIWIVSCVTSRMPWLSESVSWSFLLMTLKLNTCTLWTLST